MFNIKLVLILNNIRYIKYITDFDDDPYFVSKHVINSNMIFIKLHKTIKLITRKSLLVPL